MVLSAWLTPLPDKSIFMVIESLQCVGKSRDRAREKLACLRNQRIYFSPIEYKLLWESSWNPVQTAVVYVLPDSSHK